MGSLLFLLFVNSFTLVIYRNVGVFLFIDRQTILTDMGRLVDSMPCPSSFLFDRHHFLLQLLLHAVAVSALILVAEVNWNTLSSSLQVLQISESLGANLH